MIAWPALRALGWMLLHSGWQAVVIGLLVKLALLATRKPSFRYLWALLGSCAVLVAAIATWRVEFGHARELAALASSMPAVPSALLAHAPAPTPARLLEAALPLLVALWVIGAGGLGCYRLFGWFALARLRTRARPLTAPLTQRAEQLAARLRLTSPVHFAEAAVEVPLTLGFVRPLVLLPLGWATRLSPEQLDAALAHELAHVRRHDYLLNLVQLTIEALFFYHPCVWWMGRVIREQREHACDDLVVTHIHAPATYARALLALEQARSTTSPSLALAIDGAPLLERVQRLLRDHPSPTRAPTMPNATSTSAPISLSPLPGWAPLLSLGLALGLGLGLPACLDSVSNDEALADMSAEPLAEGLITPQTDAESNADPSSEATLQIAWLPADVEAHRSELEAAARRHGVDPALLAIVVMVESGGNPRAESPTGARGLMQIMPKTAAHIADTRGLEHDLERLWDPAVNLDYGAWYLARELQRWGDVELAAAAYNGGRAAVEAWVAGEGALSSETEHYRQSVAELWAKRGQAAL